ARVGVSLNPATSAHCLEPIISEVDLILAMTVNPGFGGQEFIPAIVPKIAQIDNMIRAQERAIYLEVDGGIDSQTAPVVIRSGANVLVAGTAIFKQDDIVAAFQQLNNCFHSDLENRI
ncbi:ribulose-phosphate 3-epimerase, partial [candidate division KSB1 bacterium]|nr:ribulose-phosphate 3-epimerase [candidate division KSB1 bacterium]